VIQAVERVGGRAVPHRLGARRAGDPPVLVASSARIAAEAGWQPRFTRLDDIVATALQWRIAHPAGYADHGT
jgi:UDP-glucose 4-epimerase